MIRTQVSFDKKDYEDAKKKAKALGISFAEYVRRVVMDSLPAKNDRPWMRYCGLVESGDKNASQNIDEIIYGIKD